MLNEIFTWKAIRRFFLDMVRPLIEDKVGLAAGIILLGFISIAIIGPYIMPYDPTESNYLEDGSFPRLQPPSKKFWFGTTNMGQDVLSQVIAGTRTAIMIGFISGFFIVFIGTNIGLISGYFGKHVDDFLMRVTDVAYGIPFIPFGILLVSILGVGTTNIIIAITLLLWRTSARVIRSQVLSVKERPFVSAAKVAGAGHLRLMYIHIAPNVFPLALLYVAFGVAWGILSEASLGFLGLGDPEAISWGQMLFFAFRSGSIRIAWWWVFPPGLSIILVVASCYVVGRTFEFIANPRLRKR